MAYPRRLWFWLAGNITRLGIGRFLLALLGVVLVIEGAVVAWRTESATLLLIIGATLAALGLFDWEELRAGYGDASLSLRGAGKDLSDIADNPSVPVEIREELRDVAETVTAIGEGQRPMRERFWRRTRTESYPRGPYHQYTDDGKVILGYPGGLASPLDCEVTTPSTVFRRVVPRPGMGHVVTTFPDDFPEATAPPENGLYIVRWFINPTGDPETWRTQPLKMTGDDMFHYPPHPEEIGDMEMPSPDIEYRA